MSACTQKMSTCCRKPEAADGDPPVKKKCCKSACRTKCSPCCRKQPKLPKQNLTSVLSPNHFKEPKKKCCRRKKVEVEYLHYPGDQLDDVFANQKKRLCCSRGCSKGGQKRRSCCSSPKKRSSCCPSGETSPTKRSSCCPSGETSPKKRSSCCSSGKQSPTKEEASPKKRNSCCSSGKQSPTKRSSCCSSGKQTPKPGCTCPKCSAGVQTSAQVSDQTCPNAKPCFKYSSASFPPPHRLGVHSPYCQTHGKHSVYFSPVHTQFLAAALKPPVLGQCSSSRTRRRASVYFSSPGASPKPESEALTCPSRQLQTAKESPSRPLICCPKSVSGNPSSSQTPKHFHLYRPVSWPAEIRTDSTFKELSPTDLADIGGQPLPTPPSTSARPSYGDNVPSATSPIMPALAAPDPQQPKSILKLPSSTGAVDPTSIASPTPNPQQRPSIRADASTSIASPATTPAPEFFKSQTTQICSPTLVLNSPRSTTSSCSSSSSRENSPSRLSSSCFFFGRSPKRSRPNVPGTLEPDPQKSKSLYISAPPTEELHHTTSTSSEQVPRSCPQQEQTDPALPTISQHYCRLPSRPQIDPITCPHYQQSASLSYDSRAQTRSRTGLVAIPDISDPIPSPHYQQSASSSYDSRAQTRSRTFLPEIPHDLEVSSPGEQSEPPLRPPGNSWFRKPRCGEPGRARKFWDRLWNKSTGLSSAAGSRLQDLASFLNPIISASKGPANPEYIKDPRWIECSDTRAFFIFGVNVVIVIFLTYFVDLLHDGKQKAETVRAADQSHNSRCCHHQDPPSHYRGYPVYNRDSIQ